jgi:hypothetical protein
MSFDLVAASIVVFLVAQAGILLFGAYRGIEIARSMVGSLYRRRAYWIPVLMVVIVLNNFVSNFSPQNLIGGIASLATPFVLVLVLLRVVSAGIGVAIQTDFFHRDTLHWATLGRVASLVMVVSLLLGFGAIFVLYEFYQSPADVPELLQLAVVQFEVLFVVIFSYEAVVLLVASLRTSDKTFRNHVRFLGLALALALVTNAIDLPSNGLDIYALADYGIGVIATYFLYRSVMSLSVVGKIEKVAGSALPPASKSG